MFLVSSLQCFLLVYFIAFGMFSHYDYRTLFLFFCFFIFWIHTFSYNVFSQTRKNFLKKNLWFQILALERFSVSNPLGAFLLRPFFGFQSKKKQTQYGFDYKNNSCDFFYPFLSNDFLFKDRILFFIFISSFLYLFFVFSKETSFFRKFPILFFLWVIDSRRKNCPYSKFSFSTSLPQFYQLGVLSLLKPIDLKRRLVYSNYVRFPWILLNNPYQTK